ncbi:MAG: hypothetical protein ABIB93_07420 [Chloroflexota bacterium]
MAELNKQILKYVIDRLSTMDHPTDKVVVQKVVFYLREIGVPVTYSFEPYMYGPYSRDLSDDADELDFLDELTIYDNKYTKGARFVLSQQLNRYKSLINKGITDFASIVSNDFDFEAMELFGTVLYCIRVLQEMGETPSFTNVLHEFRDWKGENYSGDAIKKAYTSLIGKFS